MIHGRIREDASVWIGYADFLTTLVVLFFILAVVRATGDATPEAGYVLGTVRESGGGGLDGCDVQVGVAEPQQTDGNGTFSHAIDGLSAQIRTSVEAACRGYNPVTDLVTVRPGDTTRVTLEVDRARTAQIGELPGDALFPRNENYLLDGAAAAIVAEIRQLQIDPGDIILVQGHSDDEPFIEGSVKDNWVLSAERAAAAARVLTDSTYGLDLSPCQVVIMGFGPSRPKAVTREGDSDAEVAEKRAVNRRIEFRRLRGSEVASGECIPGT